MNTVVTKGIVLRRTDYGEADRILHVLTDSEGKQGIIAKGARKQQSKLAAGIELLSVNELTYLPGRGQLATLTSSRVAVHFSSIVKDYDRVMYAYRILKAADSFTEDTAGPEYFQLTAAALAGLDGDMPLETMRLWFAIRLMTLLGSLPNLLQTPTGQPLLSGDRFDFSFEDMCFVTSETGIYSTDHVKLLRLSASAPRPETLMKITAIDELASPTQQLAQAMVGHQLSVEL